MYAFIAGRLEDVSSETVVVSDGGLGYAILVPERLRRRLPAVGEQVKLYTHLHVREDDLTLYGFFSPSEREIFKALLSISGVGPKLALAILGDEDFQLILEGARRGDAAPLTRIKGVGKKTAERLVVELRDREISPIESYPGATQGAASSDEEATLALLGMGLSLEAARRAVGSLSLQERENAPVEEIVRRALRAVAI
jgi:Holliday junction DNA helicase RuvA